MKKENMKKLRAQAEELVQKLTLDEKIGMVHGAQLFQTKGVDRLGIPPLKMSDGPMGVRQEFQPSTWQTVGLSDDLVTYLPCNSALAATWNRLLAARTGSVLGEEARGRGKDVILAPGINIKRSPLCGRNFEYFSEDPYLTKELAVPFIQGVQNWDVAACVKHFAANNQETERLWVDVKIDEKALREIYLPAFRAAVEEADSYTIMTAYNKLNGTHCYANKHLLDDILRKEWGYEGTVISDWGGVHDTKMAAEAALDIEMSVTDNFEEYYLAQPLKKAIQEGEIKEEQLDEKVIHILMLMMRMHIIEGAQENRPRKSGTYNTEEHRRETLQVARESVVLLKNEKQRLPLHPEKTKKLLVIGENAECVHSNGGGSAEIKALYEITPLMGIKTLLGGNAEVRFIKGYCRDGKVEKSDVNWQEASLENGGGSTKTGIASVDAALKAKRKSLRREAVELAAQYEDVILIGGLNHDCDSEGNDRADMKLPHEQDLLIKEVLKANPNTIIVMMGGSPVEMHKWINQAQAVVWNWYSGMEGGRALAEVLFGKVNPSGKLPETFYVRHTDCSAHAVGEFPGGEAVHYTEGVFVGYRYNDTFHISPQFCFGHGLSYTTFAYSNPSVRWQNGCCIVTLEVENIGELDGKETVQVYAAPVKRLEDEPVQQLKGFEKVTLAAGEKKNAEIVVEVPEEKRVRLRIGSSSRDIRLEMEV
jgi:beta-glucosidase